MLNRRGQWRSIAALVPQNSRGTSLAKGHTRWVAALVSGGLDSAVLAASLARAGRRVAPVFIRQGLRWEAAEQYWLRRWLARLPGKIAPLVTLDLPAGDLYDPRHWSVAGRRVPQARDPDEAVELPGRNLLLAAKAAVYCARQGIPQMAFGTLRGNPFADATPAFRRALSAALTAGLGRRLTVIAPLAGLTKAQVIRRGLGLPLGWTFSCLQPRGRRHCGRCQKCGERRSGFLAAGVPDPTSYAVRGV